MLDSGSRTPPRRGAGAAPPVDPGDFLREHPPFDRLSEGGFAAALRSLEIVYARPGETLLTRGGEVNHHLFVVRKGAVHLATEGRHVELIEEGEPFGFPSLIAGASPQLDAVADTECLLYRFPEGVFRALMAEPDFASFFLEGLHERLRKAVAADPPLMAADLSASVRELIERPPERIDPEATVADAARAMSRAGVSSLIVDTIPPGILTDRDLRNRILARGQAPDTPVSRAWTRPIHTLGVSSTLFDAIAFMLERRVHHVPLVDDGEIVGVITDTDLLRRHLNSPFHLLKSIDRTDDPEGLVGYGDNLAGIVESMMLSGLDAAQIGRVVATLNDAVIGRVLRRAEEALGPAPCAWAFIVHGSEGRREQALLTDQDNAIVYAEHSQAAEGYFARLARAAVDGLVQASFPPCAGGFMATNWCRPLADWRGMFQRWIAAPEPDALLEAANFFDFRKITGTLDLGSLDDEIAAAGRNRLFLAQLARAGISFRPPLGLFRTLKEEAGGIDLKRGGLMPIVGLARLHALEAGSTARGTLERLAAARAAGVLSGDGAEQLGEAFRFLFRLRLERQLQLHRGGGPPSNHVPLDLLTPLERRHLKDSFSLIREMQEAAGSRFAVDHLG